MVFQLFTLRRTSGLLRVSMAARRREEHGDPRALLQLVSCREWALLQRGPSWAGNVSCPDICVLIAANHTICLRHQLRWGCVVLRTAQAFQP